MKAAARRFLGESEAIAAVDAQGDGAAHVGPPGEPRDPGEWRAFQAGIAESLRGLIDNGDTTPSLYFQLAHTQVGLGEYAAAQSSLEEALRQADAAGTHPMESFTFFITERCNFRCSHCFIYDEHAEPFLRRSHELDAGEIVKIVESLRIPETNRNVFFSGGEVFARLDLEEIFTALGERGIPFSFGTNGAFPERLDKMLRLPVLEGALRNVQFSLDGTEEAHDQIRGAGSFSKLRESIAIAKSRGRAVSVITTIQRENEADLDAISALIADLGIDSHRFQLETKGRYPNNPDVETLKPYLDMRQYYLATHTEMVPGEGCSAGIRSCSIRPNGVVEACRLSVVGNVPRMILGDLKEHGLDMEALLASTQARETMADVKNCDGCALYCAH